MTQLQQLPVFTITVEELAGWLDENPQSWWRVDGDPVLCSRLDFPCPSDELANEFRKFTGKLLVVSDGTGTGMVSGTLISHVEFGRLANRENRHHERNFLLRWEGSPDFWLLSEDTSASMVKEE